MGITRKQAENFIYLVLGAAIFHTLTLFGKGAPYDIEMSVSIGVVLTCLILLFVLYTSQPDTADIWSMQRALMQMSCQPTPDRPVMSNQVITYLALVMEELAEGLNSTWGIIYAEREMWVKHAQITNIIGQASKDLLAKSQQLRKAVESSPSFSWNLRSAHSVCLLDDVTDMAVTVAGLCAAAGLPGAAAYREVQESNLSKANPETGMIDIDPSGKWIKGSEYRKPDLISVLNQR